MAAPKAKPAAKPADDGRETCYACHTEVKALKEGSKHAKLACAFCHKEKHKTVPKCQDCHGVPHPAGMMVKFGKCGECHGIAHDINNFQEVEKKEDESNMGFRDRLKRMEEAWAEKFDPEKAY